MPTQGDCIPQRRTAAGIATSPGMTRMLLPIALAVVAVFFYIYVVKNKCKSSYFLELAKKLPGPEGYPLIGNGLDVSRHSNGQLLYLYEQIKLYGKIYKLWIGNHLYVVTCDPKDIEIILRDTENITKSSTYDFLRPWLGEGLITSTSHHWHVHRKLITPAFHFSILEKFTDVFNEKGKVLISLLKKHAGGEVFNICDYLSLYTLDAIMETSMGKKINAMETSDSKYVKWIDGIKKILSTRIFNPILRQQFIYKFTSYYQKEKSLLSKINEFGGQVMEERRKELGDMTYATAISSNELGKKRRLAFLDLMVLIQKENPELTDKGIFDEVNTFLFAGHDTTFAALSFIIYLLGEHPDVQQKLYEEILSLYGDQPMDLTMKDLSEAQYLDMVIKEAFRVYPPVSSISRLLQTDLQLSKYTIPKGTSLVCFIYGLHMDPVLYPRPEKFDPERFSPVNCRARAPYDFVPFSAGLRNCIGQKYALAEVKLTLIKLLWNYRIVFGKKVEGVKLQVVLLPTSGIYVKLENRK